MYRKGLLKILRPLNICKEDELTFTAAAIILCIHINRTFNPAGICRYTHYEREQVDIVWDNLIKYGVVKDRELDFDGDLNVITLTLAAMLGAGTLVRTKANQLLLEYKPQQNT